MARGFLAGAITGLFVTGAVAVVATIAGMQRPEPVEAVTGDAGATVEPEAPAPVSDETPVVAPADETPVPEVTPEAPVATPGEPMAPGGDAMPETAPSGEPPVTETPDPEAPDETAVPQLGTGDGSAPETAPTPAGVTPPPEGGEAAEDAAPEALPMVGVIEDQVAPETERIMSEPITTITDRAEGVVTNRLPTIGTEAPAQEPPATGVWSELAIERNAAPFENPADLPVISVILADTPARANLPALADLPFAVTFEVDADAPDAEEAIAYYRSTGAEVVVLTPLPKGANASDVDVSMLAYAPMLEDAVAVMVENDLGFQTLGDGAAQLATNLAERGLGLVSYPEGLNTGHKSALQAGVPAGLVFRDLDAEGQSPVVIRRFLDNAAFKARNEDGVILYGRVREETVQALLEWTLGNRADWVKLAPLSAVLLGE